MAVVVAIVIIEAVYHAVIAVRARGKTEMDERDRLIDLKPERNAGLVLGFGLVTLVGWIVVRSAPEPASVPEPLAIAVWILPALTASEVGKLVCRICFYRASA